MIALDCLFSLRVGEFSFCLEPVIEVVAVLPAAGLVEPVRTTADLFFQPRGIKKGSDWLGALIRLHLLNSPICF